MVGLDLWENMGFCRSKFTGEYGTLKVLIYGRIWDFVGLGLQENTGLCRSRFTEEYGTL
jgi:hypothetical protein